MWGAFKPIELLHYSRDGMFLPRVSGCNYTSFEHVVSVVRPLMQASIEGPIVARHYGKKASLAAFTMTFKQAKYKPRCL